jgi:FAD/FMN-containing dehydrogenase
VNYEVVLARGDIVQANEKTNKDLWVALKGGGSSFGIVTRFDLRVFEQGPMWGGKLFYFEPSFSSQIHSLVDYLNNRDSETDVHICLSMGYAAALGSIMCMNDIFCARPVKPKTLQPFSDIQPQVDQMHTLRVGDLKEFTDEAFGGAAKNR